MKLLSRELLAGTCLALILIAAPTPLAAQQLMRGPGPTFEKLHSITLSLAFSNASLADATSFLTAESKRLDPDHKGVSFIFQPGAVDSARPVTLTLNNVPMAEALRYICQLANVKYKIQTYAVSILPFTANTDQVIKRTFTVPPNFVEPPSGPNTGTGQPSTSSSVFDVRKIFADKGVLFLPGAIASYLPRKGSLVVVNSPEQIELIECFLDAATTPVMTTKSTRFVELNPNPGS